MKSDFYSAYFLVKIGGDVQPKRDLSRFVKWPKYIRMQRQKKTLLTRLKVPPAVNQFTNTVDRNLGECIIVSLKIPI